MLIKTIYFRIFMNNSESQIWFRSHEFLQDLNYTNTFLSTETLNRGHITHRFHLSSRWNNSSRCEIHDSKAIYSLFSSACHFPTLIDCHFLLSFLCEKHFLSFRFFFFFCLFHVKGELWLIHTSFHLFSCLFYKAQRRRKKKIFAFFFSFSSSMLRWGDKKQ